MPRFNAFFMIHKALRAMLYDTSLSLQQTDFAHAADYPQSLEKLENVLETFDSHAGHEDRHIFPLLEVCNPGLQAEMEQEHVKDLALSNELRELTAAYRAASDAQEKTALGSRLCYTFYEFLAFNLDHLNKEEIVVNESLWNHYTDPEILQRNSQMIAQIAPEEVKHGVVWMMRGCSNTDLINWLSALRKQLPEPVFGMMVGIAEQELPAHRYQSLSNALMEVA